ncbi:MAG TPA: hypothetical protein RMH85_11040 [Polyangiaceae bacterium LLY-WYZ-15_(1-7)]|nr:hypothetical protein [Myxococcales bacterium]MAT29914.1 hypothetical protein [Sandaracinus sp.]HJL04419.1 hypothetical protein [Polyangiaceae bacterium LLY-WYZ-15_(1-7)]MBJ72871.1 hypothetical protein [Sandaracinus sp.]HJL09029.1 hypothetical protein [Polyangiaceae bacterium LLY-WYZ-15_(1-7)]
MLDSLLPRRASAALALAAPLCLALACGDDGGSFDTGLDRDRALSSLSDDEVRSACEATVDSGPEPTRRESCTLAGLIFAEDPASCEATRDACLATDPEPEPEEDECADASAAELAGCDATVGQLEDCWAAQNAQTEAFLADLSCSLAGTEIEEPATPAECAALEERCPDAFGSSDDGASSEGSGGAGDPEL